jgi:hypothetical protein
MEKQMADGDRT